MRFSIPIVSLCVLMLASASPAFAGKKDDAWAKCLWDQAPVSTSNWLELPVPDRRQGIRGIKPEFALLQRLKAACSEALTEEGKNRPPSFSIKKVRKAIIQMKPATISSEEVDPKAYVCTRFFENDTEMKNPAAFRWGYGDDFSMAQLGAMSFMFAAKAGGSVGLADDGGLEKCQFVKQDGTLTDA